MCRSIKTLRPPYTDDPGVEDVQAAARQYVRKISGFHRPAPHNAEVFERAVAAIAAATEELLDGLVVKGARPGAKEAS
ncbi:DUF2277 domain-containing protein [Actinokineospora sp. NPDC004072]